MHVIFERKSCLKGQRMDKNARLVWRLELDDQNLIQQDFFLARLLVLQEISRDSHDMRSYSLSDADH